MTWTKKAIALFVFGLVATVCTRAQGNDVAVIVNPSNSVSNLSLVEVRKLFAGQKRSWPGGQAVRLFVRAPGNSERAALLKLLDMSESDYKTYWTTMIFRGEAQNEPAVLPSNGMQMEAIRSFPGGIALLTAREVRTGLKVVKIDGRLPGEAGYPLH
jgi:ABC-type phosphate transport system substrate-binding protein